MQLPKERLERMASRDDDQGVGEATMTTQGNEKKTLLMIGDIVDVVRQAREEGYGIRFAENVEEAMSILTNEPGAITGVFARSEATSKKEFTEKEWPLLEFCWDKGVEMVYRSYHERPRVYSLVYSLSAEAQGRGKCYVPFLEGVSERIPKFIWPLIFGD